jgi:hypothetical protein
MWNIFNCYNFLEQDACSIWKFSNLLRSLCWRTPLYPSSDMSCRTASVLRHADCRLTLNRVLEHCIRLPIITLERTGMLLFLSCLEAVNRTYLVNYLTGFCAYCVLEYLEPYYFLSLRQTDLSPEELSNI